MKTDRFHDRNVAAVAKRLEERAKVGLAKYGTDTTRDDFSLVAWLQELQDELLDAAIYVQAALGRYGETRQQLEALQAKIDARRRDSAQ